jgi:hypothetical protein
MRKEEGEEPTRVWWGRIGCEQSEQTLIILVSFLSVIAGILIVTTVFLSFRRINHLVLTICIDPLSTRCWSSHTEHFPLRWRTPPWEDLLSAWGSHCPDLLLSHVANTKNFSIQCAESSPHLGTSWRVSRPAAYYCAQLHSTIRGHRGEFYSLLIFTAQSSIPHVGPLRRVSRSLVITAHSFISYKEPPRRVSRPAGDYYEEFHCTYEATAESFKPSWWLLRRVSLYFWTHWGEFQAPLVDTAQSSTTGWWLPRGVPLDIWG